MVHEMATDSSLTQRSWLPEIKIAQSVGQPTKEMLAETK